MRRETGITFFASLPSPLRARARHVPAIEECRGAHDGSIPRKSRRKRMGTQVAHVGGTMDHPFLYSPAAARVRSALRPQIPWALIACALACAGLVACDP